MKTNRELYGSQKPMDIPQEVIDDRVELLTYELEKEQTMHLMVRKHAKVNRLLKAIEFWRTINEQ